MDIYTKMFVKFLDVIDLYGRGKKGLQFVAHIVAKI